MTAALAKLDPHIFVIIGYLRTMSSFVILWHVVGQLCWFEAGSGGGGLIFNDWSDQAGHQATNHHSNDEDDNGDDEDNYGGPDQVKKTLKKCQLFIGSKSNHCLALSHTKSLAFVDFCSKCWICQS